MRDGQLGLTLALKVAVRRLPTIAGPARGDRQRDDGADSATYRNDPCRGMMVRGGSRQDHDDSLAQAHTTLR